MIHSESNKNHEAHKVSNYQSDYKNKDIGAGVVVPIRITDGPNAGEYVLSGNSFRGVNASMGGSSQVEAGKDGAPDVMDEFAYQTAHREFMEEAFGGLIEMRGELGRQEFNNKMSQWGFEGAQIDEMNQSLGRLESSVLHQNIMAATTPEALSRCVPADNQQDAAGFVRLTYMAETVEVSQQDAVEYLDSVSKLAGMFNAKMAEKMKETGLDTPRDQAMAVDVNPETAGLSDFAESSNLGLVNAKDQRAAIAARMDHAVPDGHDLDIESAKKIKCNFVTADNLQNGTKPQKIKMQAPSLKAMRDVSAGLAGNVQDLGSQFERAAEGMAKPQTSELDAPKKGGHVAALIARKEAEIKASKEGGRG